MRSPRNVHVSLNGNRLHKVENNLVKVFLPTPNKNVLVFGPDPDPVRNLNRSDSTRLEDSQEAQSHPRHAAVSIPLRWFS
nr:hypothetical protein CFP56_75002 [Quercus suber]